MKLTPKGMRDIGPEDMFVREEVVGKIRRMFQLYGYRPLETPAMEYLETLRAKAGEEVDKQIFVIEGGEYGLRFDLTVPLARYAAATDAPKPFKRYAIDVVWRKEEPQRGRFREFYQADADIIGSSSMRCEAELLSIASTLCISFGFGKPRILMNNRKILEGIAAKLELGKNKDETFRVLDKLDKIGEAEVERLLNEILGKKKAKELLDIVNTKGDNKKKLAIAEKYSPEGAKELDEILTICENSFDIEVSLPLARGLGYYTGPVFEIKLSEGIGTVIAGGRYDNLIGVYGQPAPATGISIGIERLVTLITERKKATKKTDTRVFLAVVKPELYTYTLENVAAKFRIAGVECETDLNERNLHKQFDYANSLSIPYVAIIGEREMKNGTVTLRDMASGKEESLKVEEALKRLKR